MKTIPACLAVALLLAAPASAKDTAKTVHFAKGETSATLTGSVAGYDTLNYKLGAAGGQTLTVSFAPKNTSCYFNIVAPGADSALFMGEVSGNDYSGTLPSSGTYTVQVYLMRNAARRGETCKHTIAFSITGAAAQPHAATPSADEQACLQAVSVETGNGDVVLISSEESEAATEVVVGVGPQRARWRCLAKNGVVSEVMSLTDEGAL